MRILFLLVFYLSTVPFSSGETDPVCWTFSAKSIKTDEFTIIFEAKMSNNWHIYSQELGEEARPTTFYFLPTEDIEFISPKIEENGETVNTNSLKFFKNRATFTTNIRLKKSNTKLLGYVNFITCNGEQCLSPKDIPFEFTFGR